MAQNQVLGVASGQARVHLRWQRLRRRTSGIDLAAAGSNYVFQTDNTSLTAAMLGVGSSTQRELVIRWIRGRDNVTATNVANESVARDQLGQAPAGVTVRPSIHGDVLHSRPVAINYGGTRGVVVYYGSNDGMLRAINGNKTGSGAGTELWAFVAPEHFASLNRLRENDPQIRYPSTPAAVTGAIPRNYYFDGPIGAYQNTATNEVLLFPGMRRGGRAIYAFNATDPDRPRLLWRINQHDGRLRLTRTNVVDATDIANQGEHRSGADHGRWLRPGCGRFQSRRRKHSRSRRLRHQHAHRRSPGLYRDGLQRAS